MDKADDRCEQGHRDDEALAEPEQLEIVEQRERLIPFGRARQMIDAGELAVLGAVHAQKMRSATRMMSPG